MNSGGYQPPPGFAWPSPARITAIDATVLEWQAARAAMAQRRGRGGVSGRANRTPMISVDILNSIRGTVNQQTQSRLFAFEREVEDVEKLASGTTSSDVLVDKPTQGIALMGQKAKPKTEFLVNPVLEQIIGVMKASKDISVNDLVMASLTCKLFAQKLRVTKGDIPAPIPNAILATEVHSRNRLNFMLRLSPWFDELSARRDSLLGKLPLYKDDGSPMYKEIHYANNGFSFCAGCLKYRPHGVFLIQIPHKNYPYTVRWTSCMAHKMSARSTRTATVSMATPGADELLFADYVQGWTMRPVDKTKLPLFKRPKAIKAPRGQSGGRTKTTAGRASAVGAEVVHSKSAAIGAKRKIVLSPGNVEPVIKKKKKITAPEDEDHARAREAVEKKRAKEAEEAAEKADISKILEGTGMEDCYYLPMDASGEVRLNEFWICDKHVPDPIRFVGL